MIHYVTATKHITSGPLAGIEVDFGYNLPNLDLAKQHVERLKKITKKQQQKDVSGRSYYLTDVHIK